MRIIAIISCVLACCIMSFSCKTMVKIESLSAAESDFNLRQKKVLIITHSTPSSKDVMVYLKKYMTLWLSEEGVPSSNINIRHDTPQDSIEMLALKTSFKPDVVLSIYPIDIKNMDLNRIGELNIFKVKEDDEKIQHATFAVQLTEPNAAQHVWQSKLKIKNVFDSDKITAARQAAEKVIHLMKTDKILKPIQ